MKYLLPPLQCRLYFASAKLFFHFRLISLLLMKNELSCISKKSLSRNTSDALEINFAFVDT